MIWDYWVAAIVAETDTGEVNMIRKVNAAVIGVAFLLVGPLAIAAESTPPDSSGVVDRGDGQIGFIYWSDGYLAMVGEAIDFCVLPEPPTAPGGMTVSPANGAVIEFTRTNVPVTVYQYPGVGGPSDPGGGFAFLGANCGAIFDGDPNTEPIAPVATGTVRLKAKFQTGIGGVADSRNTLNGFVTTVGGEHVKLRAAAHVVLADGGATLVSLETLAVHYGG